MSNLPLALTTDTFIQGNPPRKRGQLSRLIPYRAGIFDLSSRGYGPQQIAQWLAANGLQISASAVGNYIRREMERGGVEG